MQSIEFSQNDLDAAHFVLAPFLDFKSASVFTCWITMFFASSVCLTFPLPSFPGQIITGSVIVAAVFIDGLRARGKWRIGKE